MLPLPLPPTSLSILRLKPRVGPLDVLRARRHRGSLWSTPGFIVGGSNDSLLGYVERSGQMACRSTADPEVHEGDVEEAHFVGRKWRASLGLYDQRREPTDTSRVAYILYGRSLLFPQ